MDYKLIWSPQAIEDVEAIAQYIARDSTIYAESTIEQIFQAPEKLIQFPKLGRIVPEKNDESIREVFIFQYRIIYEIVASEVHILTVVHGKRIIEDLI
ncbi:MAG TPA: type II toxin-antitoxin system RelE/ParE family toxin [Sedimentisphaerales bacterium]|nr:type II toxin-antitoxin system RelE/ParE family toxin [Sedimentisphaerales bacterium]